MPESRPMPSVGLGCHELRIDDLETKKEWRVIYYLAEDAIVVLDVFAKNTPRTPTAAIARSKARLAKFRKDLLP
jgi:phage-related protein